MYKVLIKLWDREFELTVSFQNYPGEEITETQLKTLQSISTVNYDSAKAGVESYVRKWFSAELDGENLNDLFQFVMPKSVVITRENDMRCFALMCNFKLDREHGIAIVFENEQFKVAGPQDIIL